MALHNDRSQPRGHPGAVHPLHCRLRCGLLLLAVVLVHRRQRVSSGALGWAWCKHQCLQRAVCIRVSVAAAALGGDRGCEPVTLVEFRETPGRVGDSVSNDSDT